MAEVGCAPTRADRLDPVTDSTPREHGFKAASFKVDGVRREVMKPSSATLPVNAAGRDKQRGGGPVARGGGPAMATVPVQASTVRRAGRRPGPRTPWFSTEARRAATLVHPCGGRGIQDRASHPPQSS